MAAGETRAKARGGGGRSGLLAACLLGCGLLAAPARAQRFAVELDKPAHERWDLIVPRYAEAYAAVADALTSTGVTHVAVLAVERLLRAAPALFARIYPGELVGEFASIGKGVGMSAERVAAIALVYDLTAGARRDGSSSMACTGVVAQAAGGAIIHGRNLDYRSAEQLKPLAALVDFRRGGRVLFTATVFIGMPVFNTVQVAGGCAAGSPWSLSQNERDQGDVRVNWLRLASGSAPATFAQIRRVAESACSFGEALGMLQALPLPAYSYFVLAGTAAGEGAVVARDRDAAANVWRLPAAPNASSWWLLETNYDHLSPPAPRDRRRAVAQRFLRRYSPANFTAQAMWLLLSDRRADERAGERGVWNNTTVYSQVMMQPRAPQPPTLRFQTRGRYPGPAPPPE